MMKKLSSVQRAFVPVREAGSDYLALECTQGRLPRECCAVLEVSGLNYLLKSEEEQRLINDVFRIILASLTHPLQVLMQVRPFDLARYLSCFQSSVASGHAWKQLAGAYTHFLQEHEKLHPLMERRFFIIVPSARSTEEELSTSLVQKAIASFWHSRYALPEELAQIHQRLSLRCSELMRQISAMGLSVRRLQTRELIDLSYHCLNGSRARTHPLHDAWLEGLDCPLVTHSEPARLLPLSISEARTPDPPAAYQQKKQKQQKRRIAERAEILLRWPELADLIAPAGVMLWPDRLFVDSEWVQVLDVHTLPRQVSPGWFNRLATIDVPFELCLYYVPLSAESTMRQLQRKRFEVGSTNELNAEKGRHQPASQIVQADIEDLMNRVASGQDRLLEFSMRVVVRGESRRELERRAARVRSSLHTMLLGSRICFFEQDKAFRSCLPYARNELHHDAQLTLASHEASATFPFLSHSLLMQRGVLEGITLQGEEPIICDWWAREYRNANRLIVAPTGSGKSFKAKMDQLRAHLWYSQHTPREQESGNKSQTHSPAGLRYQTIVIDIEREYQRIASLLKGQWIRMAPGTTHFINPFDLPAPQGQSGATEEEGPHEDALAEKIAHLQGLLDIMLAEKTAEGEGGRLSNTEKGILDQALYTCYQQRGITSHPGTHNRTPPLLLDLYQVLGSIPEAASLAHRLHRYVSGSLCGLFSNQTNVSLHEAPVICFDIHDLPTDLRPVVLFLISSHVWTISFGSRIPRQFIVDELLTLFEYPEGKSFLESLFQRARKHYLSVVGITQYPRILLASTIPSNCATTIVMAQELASLPLVQEIFHLSETEEQLVRSFGKGEALLLTNDKRFAVRFVASPLETFYCTTDPTDLAQVHEEMAPSPVASEKRPAGIAALEAMHEALVEQPAINGSKEGARHDWPGSA